MESGGSKKITQEYFDSIVKENMADFGMEQQEAIDDAVSQLKAQGIDLTTICKFPQQEQKQLLDAIRRVGDFVKKLYPANQGLESISEEKATSGSKEQNDKLDEPVQLSDALIDECLKDLEVIKATFDKDLSFRCLATSAKNGHNAYHMFLSYLNNLKYPTEQDHSAHEKIDKLTSSLLSTFQSYLNQQSDALDSNGLRTLIRLTASNLNEAHSGFGDRPVVLQPLLKCINTSCQMSESNRQFYVENGLCENLMQLFSKHKENDHILCDACQLVRSLLLDDDMRVEFGHAHEHAKYIASQLNGIDVLLQIGLGKHSHNWATAPPRTLSPWLQLRNGQAYHGTVRFGRHFYRDWLAAILKDIFPRVSSQRDQTERRHAVQYHAHLGKVGCEKRVLSGDLRQRRPQVRALVH